MSKRLIKNIKSAQAGEREFNSTEIEGFKHLPAIRTISSRKIRTSELPTMTGEILRIYAECDPVGFLMDIINGKAIETHRVRPDRDGMPEVMSSFETPSLGQRIHAAQYLADKYLPKIAVVKHAHLHKLSDEGEPKPGQENFAQLVSRAARAAETVVEGEYDKSSS